MVHIQDDLGNDPGEPGNGSGEGPRPKSGPSWPCPQSAGHALGWDRGSQCYWEAILKLPLCLLWIVICLVVIVIAAPFLLWEYLEERRNAV